MRILWSTNVNTCNRRYSETSQKGCWLGPKGTRVVWASPTGLDTDINPAGGQGGPKVFVVKYAERGNPVSSPGAIRAGATARHAVGDAELRGWKKRMPFCNGADTGFKVTRPEREQTSIWCPAARTLGESRKEGMQMTLSQDGGAPSAFGHVTAGQYRRACHSFAGGWPHIKVRLWEA